MRSAASCSCCALKTHVQQGAWGGAVRVRESVKHNLACCKGSQVWRSVLALRAATCEACGWRSDSCKGP